MCVAVKHVLTSTDIHRIGKKLHFRQRILSTATVFFKRFYLKCAASTNEINLCRASFCEFDPRLVAPTMVFIAAKVEECGFNALAFIGVLEKLGIDRRKMLLTH